MVPTNLRSKQPSQSPTVLPSVPDIAQMRKSFWHVPARYWQYPKVLLSFKNDSTFVYVLTDSVPSQKFSRRAVITGMSDGIQIEIKNGLNVNAKSTRSRKEITEYHYEETNHYSLGHPDCITGRFPKKNGIYVNALIML